MSPEGWLGPSRWRTKSNNLQADYVQAFFISLHIDNGRCPDEPFQNNCRSSQPPIVDCLPVRALPVSHYEQLERAFELRQQHQGSGYLVLHESHYETTGHLSVCQSCGQRNFKACGLVDGDNACGRCHAVGERGRRNFASPPQQLSVANCGIDTDRDFSEWSISQLKERVELVIAFDEACEEIRSNFISLLSLEVIEETVFVPQKVFVLRERQAA